MRAILLLASISVCFAASPSSGQTPSVEQLIKQLTPKGDVSKAPTLGIKSKSDPLSSGSAPSGTVAMTTDSPATQPKPVPKAPAPSADLAAADLTVNFENGSAVLTPQAREALNTLGSALTSQTLSNFRFRVEGHTDTVGSAEQNKALSQQRADAVVAYLTETFHIEASRLDPIGLGFSHPLIVTGLNVPEPRNRRVHVVNRGG